jgi:hypothetical protein
MASLFGPTPQELIFARMREDEKMRALRNQQIGQEGGEFGVFAPLYQAGRRFGEMGSQAIVKGLFPESEDPSIRQAQAVQLVQQKYQGKNLGDPSVLKSIASDLFTAGAPDAGLRILKTAEELTPKDKLITGKAGDIIYRQTPTGSLEQVAAVPDREAMIKTPQDFALTGQSLGIPIKANPALYTREETQRIQSKILEDKKAQARASATTINTADPGWQVKAVGEVNSQTKENDTQLTYISQAVNTTINRRTPFDQKAFESLVGNVFGGKVRAQAEIERLKNSGTLGQRLDNTLTLFLEGKIGQTTRDNQMEVLLSLYELSGKQRDAIVGQYKGILGAEADKVALTTEQRHPLPPLTGNREYIPMSVVNQYNLSKGQKVKQGNKEFVYNGDGTITVLKKGE